MAEIKALLAALACMPLCAQAAAVQASLPSRDPLAACRLAVQSPRTDVALGIPRAPFRLKATGDVRFAVLFVDFSDAPAAMTPQEALAVVAPAQEFMRTVSYGKMRLAFTPHYQWLRMSKPSTDYGMARGITFQAHKAYIEEAVRLAGDALDGRDADALLVLANPAVKAIDAGPAFTPVPPFGIRAGGKTLLNAMTSGGDLLHWGWAWFPHELGHDLSLPDLYGDGAAGRYLHAHVGEFGIMGQIGGRAPEYFAWERWQLGWLDDAQVACVTGRARQVRLEPVERPGGVKMAIVPTGPASAVVVESRRAEGYDRDLPQPGVLVYEIDTHRPSQQGPLRILPRTAIDAGRFGSVLLPGKGLHLGGLSIVFKGSDARGDTIEVVNDSARGVAVHAR
jgi:M6 family metalloprotease-like protein